MKILIDSHVHSTLSHDGKSSVDEHIKKMEELGLSEITLTEHYDRYEGVESNLHTIDLDNYKKVYDDLKNDKVNFGIEIGLRPECSKEIIEDATKYPFDFIIGSSHITCGKDMSKDESFFYGKTKEEAINTYLNEVLENIHLYHDYFDVYGHIDYVVRYIIKYYGLDNTYKLDYTVFKDKLDEILSSLIKYGKGIEINTSGIRYGLGVPHPTKEIIKRYKELGGKIITVGSDAHVDTDLAADFDIALDILLGCGFAEYTVYHKRTPHFYSIK